MTSIHLELQPDAARLLEVHARAMPQKDEVCGAFWGAVAIATLTGQDVSQDEVAQAAATLLSESPDSDSLPTGHAGRRDYILQLPTISDSTLAGTSPAGLVRAIGGVSRGALCALPIRGPWREDTVLQLIEMAGSEDHAVLVFNVATRFLWGSRIPTATVLRYLLGKSFSEPPPDWDVGHFIGVVGLIRGASRPLALCADTYPTIGRDGLYVQPPHLLAAALRRDAMPTAGGAIVVIPVERQGAVHNALMGVGFEIGAWDNGVPDKDARTS